METSESFMEEVNRYSLLVKREKNGHSQAINE
jgi:hypothetical protein